MSIRENKFNKRCFELPSDVDSSTHTNSQTPSKPLKNQSPQFRLKNVKKQKAVKDGLK